MSSTTVKGFEVRLDRSYDLTHHMWVMVEDGLARIGMDALGLETSGTLAHLSLGDVSSEVKAGESFGSLEAEKYVGPLVSPISGELVGVNGAILEDPGLVQRDPYDKGWMVQISPSNTTELDALLSGEDEIVEAFGKKVVEYRLEGVLAE